MIRVREAIPSDASSIVQFQIDMAKETEDYDLDRKTVESGVVAVFADSQKGIYYVAEDQGKVVASLLTTYEWSDWRNGTIIWIQSVFVRKEYRRKGIYSAVYKYIKEKVGSDDTLKGIRLYVEHNNKKAQTVYEKLGMSADHYQLYEWLK